AQAGRHARRRAARRQDGESDDGDDAGKAKPLGENPDGEGGDELDDDRGGHVANPPDDEQQEARQDCPTSTLPRDTTASNGSADQAEKLPATAAATARRYTSSALASLKRLSPSRITSSRCGGRICLSTAVAAAASGGATMAPRAIAAGQGKPGTQRRATTAT